jgi:hypothetical protein
MGKKPTDQAAKFRDLARELESDEDEGRFNDRLGKITKQKPTDKSEKKPGN